MLLNGKRTNVFLIVQFLWLHHGLFNRWADIFSFALTILRPSWGHPEAILRQDSFNTNNDIIKVKIFLLHTISKISGENVQPASGWQPKEVSRQKEDICPSIKKSLWCSTEIPEYTKTPRNPKEPHLQQQHNLGFKKLHLSARRWRA